MTITFSGVSADCKSRQVIVPVGTKCAYDKCGREIGVGSRVLVKQFDFGKYKDISVPNYYCGYGCLMRHRKSVRASEVVEVVPVEDDVTWFRRRR
ncbi:MAG: hypothetical protein KKF56_00380 [Nanoarchaeota archaeon]|nr:hypothetical protein [Nanoarchaeota archaeon]